MMINGMMSREKSLSKLARKRLLWTVEEQQKKALEEDPTVFDYDGVYDKMKEKVARPLIQDREQRKSRYIQKREANITISMMTKTNLLLKLTERSLLNLRDRWS